MGKNEIAKKDDVKNITDVVLNKVTGFAQAGELVLPPDYSAENALKAAWLALQAVEDKNGNKALDVCSKASIANSLLDMVVQGLSPAKKQCYFIPYGKELTLVRSYMGTVAVAKRFSDVKDVRAQVVYEGDEFEYTIDTASGSARIIKHTQSLNNVDITKIKAVYAIVAREEDEPYVEIMTMAQIRKAWNQGATKGGSPAHKNFTEEMAKKTVINRACKLFVNTSSDSAILTGAFNRATKNEYGKPDEVIDVEAEELQEVKSEAEAAVFGSDEEKSEDDVNPHDEEKNAPIQATETPFDDPVSEQEEMEVESE